MHRRGDGGFNYIVKSKERIPISPIRKQICHPLDAIGIEQAD